MALTRREFLKRMGLGLFWINLCSMGLLGWAAGLVEAAPELLPTRRKRLVVIFLRGAVDGLSVVVPHFESAYYDARPTIALEAGGSGLLELDPRFGMHPGLVSLLPLWQQQTLAFVHACGSPDPSRSHFDAQRFMECGTPGVITTADGWMNRLLGVLPGPHTPTQAISLGPVEPQILRGPYSVANFPLGRQAGRAMPMDRPMVAGAFDALYNGDDPLSKAYREGQAARRMLLTDLQEEQKIADNGAPSPEGFAGNTDRLAKLLRQDDHIQLVFLDLGGWDTHVNQGAAQGQLANRLKQLGDGLASLTKGLGPLYDDTMILVMSEFGRTVRENGNGGTDHGHGNVLWVLGGGIQGGKIYGDWPGLTASRLYEGRDVAVTVDFRSVIAAALASHMQLTVEQLQGVFPGMPASKLGVHDLSKLAKRSPRLLTIG